MARVVAHECVSKNLKIQLKLYTQSYSHIIRKPTLKINFIFSNSWTAVCNSSQCIIVKSQYSRDSVPCSEVKYKYLIGIFQSLGCCECQSKYLLGEWEATTLFLFLPSFQFECRPSSHASRQVFLTQTKTCQKPLQCFLHTLLVSFYKSFYSQSITMYHIS